MNVTMRGLAITRRHAATVELLGACLFALTGCSDRPAARAVQPVARTPSGLTCAEPTWDVGEVLVKDKTLDLNHTFRLENRSDRAVRIRDVRTNCGCVVAKDYARTIEPGGTAELAVTLSVFGPPGPFRKTVAVLEDAEGGGTLPLELVGRRAVCDLLYSAPAVINFGTLTRGEAKTKPVVLCRYDGSAVNFRGLSGDDGRLRLDGEPNRYTGVDELRRSCDCVAVPVRLDATSLPAGPFRSKVRFQTDGSSEGTTELDVVAEALVVEAETPWVRSVFIERLGSGEAVERPLLTGELPASAPAVTSVSYEGDEAIRVELVPPPAGGGSASPMIRVRRAAGAKAGGLARGTLSVRAGAPEGAVTKIGIVAFLPK